MLGYCHLDPYQQTSVKFKSKYNTFHSRQCIWNNRLRNGGYFVQGEEGDELKDVIQPASAAAAGREFHSSMVWKIEFQSGEDLVRVLGLV